MSGSFDAILGKGESSLAVTGRTWRLCRARECCILSSQLTRPTAAPSNIGTPLNFVALKDSEDFCMRIIALNGRADTHMGRS
jgi:hypothetical protein